MIETEIPGLDPATEKGFLLDTGELVAIEVFKPAASQEGVIAIAVVARAVNPDGSTVVIGGQEAAMPGHTIAFLTEQLGAEPLLVMPAIAAAMEKEAEKVRGFMSALNSLAAFTTRTRTPTPSVRG